jgi:hypothetical protein
LQEKIRRRQQLAATAGPGDLRAGMPASGRTRTAARYFTPASRERSVLGVPPARKAMSRGDADSRHNAHSMTSHRTSAVFLQQQLTNIKVNLIGKSDLLCVNRRASASAYLQPGW